jgi:hypothetical protein
MLVDPFFEVSVCLRITHYISKRPVNFDAPCLFGAIGHMVIGWVKS